MGTPPARHARDVLAVQMHRAAVGRQFAGDEIEQRGFAGTVRANDQPPFARLDIQVDAARDTQAAEGFVETADGERAHAGVSVLAVALTAGVRLRKANRHSRALPGTSPSGIKMTMATKMAPSRKFQRSMKPDTTVLMTTTSVAPTTGPSKVPGPPEITISSTSADEVSASVCGLMNCV